MKNCIADIRASFNPKMSQEKLANSANISRVHLSEIENDKADPGGDVMLRIANVLKKNVEDIFFTDSVNHTQQNQL